MTSSRSPFALVATIGLLLATGCATTAPPPSSTTEPPEIAALEARIESDLVPGLVIENEGRTPAGIEQRLAELGIPGISLALFDGGEVVWARGYGLADVETGRPVTPETRFQAASISKPIAATAALDLVDDGLLTLDDDVNAFLTSWRVPANDLTAATPVTLRALLTHTAGTTVHGFPGYGPGEEVPTAVGVLGGAGNTDPVVVDLAPRTEERYSGGGYTVMQQMVEDVAGRPFAQVMAERVLTPLGMDHSTYEQPLPAALRPVAATGYRTDGAAVPGRFHTYPEQAAAGLWTTPTDLARWALSLGRTARGEGSHPVLAAETVAAMLTRDSVSTMGLGPALPHDGAYFGHNGANEGFRSLLVAQRGGDQGLAIMVNSDLGSVVGREVLLTVSDVLGWEDFQPTVKRVVALSPAERGRLVGNYRATDRFRIEILDDGGRLVGLQLWDDQRMPLAAESPSRLFDREDGTPLTFVLPDDGGPATRFEVQGYTFEREVEP
jgi:CubicO group peptidase (beta-lactamase class C family)